MVSGNFRYERPNGSPRININPEASQPFDLFEPERTLEQPSLRERVNEILLPDDDVMPDMTQIDMGNDPCCAEAKEMWLNELRPILGVPEGQEYDIPPGGYKYKGESLETTSIIYRYEQMDCEEFEAALRDFAGDMPGERYKTNVSSRKKYGLGPTSEHYLARRVLEAWDKCKFEGQNTAQAQDMGFYASEDAFEIAWDMLQKGAI